MKVQLRAVDLGGWVTEYAMQRELGYIQLFSEYWEGIKVGAGMGEERERDKGKEIETKRGREEEKKDQEGGRHKAASSEEQWKKERKTGENRGQLASSEKGRLGVGGASL